MLTYSYEYAIIKSQKGGKQMSKQKKNGKKEKAFQTILLLTAIINLLAQLIDLINKMN